MRDGDDKEAIARVHDTGEGVVPGQERGEDGKESAGFDDALGWLSIVLHQVPDSE